MTYALEKVTGENGGRQLERVPKGRLRFRLQSARLGKTPFANANARTDCGVHNQNQEASGEATTFDFGQSGVQLAYRWSVGKE